MLGVSAASTRSALPASKDTSEYIKCGSLILPGSDGGAAPRPGGHHGVGAGLRLGPHHEQPHPQDAEGRGHGQDHRRARHRPQQSHAEKEQR